MLDPVRPDWSAFAPLAGFGRIERTAAGYRSRTETGPLEASVFAPGILRLSLGEFPGPDFGILVAKSEPPTGIEVDETDDGVGLTAGDLRLVMRQRPLRLALSRREQVLLQSTDDGTFGERL